jgi:hypothetical protein
MKHLFWDDDRANTRHRKSVGGVRYNDKPTIRMFRDRLRDRLGSRFRGVWYDDSHIFALVRFCSGHYG